MYILIIALMLMTSSAINPEHTGSSSEYGPDLKRVRLNPKEIIQDSSPNQILDAVVRHAQLEPVVTATIALVDKAHFKLVQDELREAQIMHRIIFQIPKSRDKFIRDVKLLVSVCKERPRNVALLNNFLTEEMASLFMYRLLLIVDDELGLIVDLFGVIGQIQSVVDLTPGWIVIVLINYFNTFKADDPIKLMVIELLGMISGMDCYHDSIDDIPTNILNTVRHYADQNLEDRIPIRDMELLPDPFSRINSRLFWKVGEIISRDHDHLIRLWPTLARKLFFLGTPIDLSEMEIAVFTASELQALLPFALYVDLALGAQIQDLVSDLLKIT